MDLAEQMIRLSGFEPGRDIAIQVIGPRPGEKIHEDLFNPYESAVETEAPRILRAERPPLNPRWVEETFDHISLLVLEGDGAALATTVAELALVRVPEAAAAAAQPPPERVARFGAPATPEDAPALTVREAT
jgi:FlaA1/EpsC-like NDP-sugar epimerase